MGMVTSSELYKNKSHNLKDNSVNGKLIFFPLEHFLCCVFVTEDSWPRSPIAPEFFNVVTVTWLS